MLLLQLADHSPGSGSACEQYSRAQVGRSPFVSSGSQIQEAAVLRKDTIRALALRSIQPVECPPQCQQSPSTENANQCECVAQWDLGRLDTPARSGAPCSRR